MHASFANLYFAAFARNLMQYSQSCFRGSLNFSYITLSVSSCRIWQHLECTQGLHRVYKVDAVVRIIHFNVGVIKLFFRKFFRLSKWRKSCDSTTAVLSQGDYPRWKWISVENLNSSWKNYIKRVCFFFFIRSIHLFKVEAVWRSHQLVW